VKGGTTEERPLSRDDRRESEIGGEGRRRREKDNKRRKRKRDSRVRGPEKHSCGILGRGGKRGWPAQRKGIKARAEVVEGMQEGRRGAHECSNIERIRGG